MRRELKSLWFVSMKMSSVEAVARDNMRVCAAVELCPAQPGTGTGHLGVPARQERREDRLNRCWKLPQLLGAYLTLCFMEFSYFMNSAEMSELIRCQLSAATCLVPYLLL